MVNLQELEKNFRRFRSEFWEDVTDVNLEEGKTKIEEVETKMVKSDYFRAVKEFAEEKGWDVVKDDLIISIKKEDKNKTLEVPLVNKVEGSKLFIQPWSKVIEKLDKLEKE